MKKILVTGGLGFIGSHTVVELQNEGFEVVIIDDLSNTTISVLDNITDITGIKPTFHKADVRNKSEIKAVFDAHKIDGIIHFAAFKAVGESIAKPLDYYENNLSSLIYILQEVRDRKLDNFIFSSSCTVYGQADEMPITENAPVKTAESPYGNTKQMGEEIIADTCKVTPELKAIALRYFNPMGAHPSVEIGELPKGVPQNLVPFITQTAAGLRDELKVFGNDYDTIDGTCVRDYIHVMDVAEAHVKGIDWLNSQNGSFAESLNIGTGKGTSVLEIIHTFEKVSALTLNWKFGNRREGDVEEIYANVDKSSKLLNWKPTKTVKDAIFDAWNWELKLNND